VRSLMVLVAMVSVGLMGAAAASRGPTAAELDRANAQCELNNENTVTHKYSSGLELKFVPAKIGDMNDTERARGVIIGKLITPKETPDGLKADTYRAYLCKEGGKWCVYWIQGNKVIAKASSCVVMDDNAHEPRLVENSSKIHYWEVKFSF
jgi:hypothetical protein